MRPFALAALLVALPFGAAAEVVAIRSGDHPSFARLVLSIPPGANWELGRTEDGYGLTLEGVDGFDTSRVFSRISRRRIAGLEAEGGRLDLRLACNCHADAFLWREDRLVLDVVDGPAPADSPFEVALAGDGEGATTLPSPTMFRLEATVLPVVFDAVPEALPAATDPMSDAVTPAPTEEPEAPPTGLDQMSRMETTLRADLQNAAARGLIGLDAELPEEGLSLSTPEGGGPGLNARTPIVEIVGARDLPGTCPPSDAFDVVAWIDPEETFFEQLSARRAALASDEGGATPADAAVIALARLYAAAGFGAETELALTLLDDGTGAEARALRLMAQVTAASGPGQVPTAPANSGCSGSVQLWTALARGDLAGTTAADQRNMLATFARLPAPLKARLGPWLATILAEDGQTSVAASVLNGALHSPGADPAQVSGAEAALALASEGPDPAVEVLAQAAEEDATLTPASLAELIELSLRRGLPVADHITDLADALRFEHRGTPEAERLSRAEVQLTAANGDYERALALLGRGGPMAAVGVAEENRPALIGEVLLAMTERGSDATFLDIAFSDRALDAPVQATHAMATRLLDLGFAERAAELLAPPLAGRDGAERRALRARAFAALEELGEAPPAVETQEAAPPVEESQALSAWRAEDFNALGQSQDPVLRDVARIVEPAPAVQADAPPLAARRALLDQSAETRSMIDDLLTRFPVGPIEGETSASN